MSMRHTIILSIFMSLLVAGCTESAKQPAAQQTPDSLIIDPNFSPAEKDVTLYGLFLEYGGDSLHMITDAGDTVSFAASARAIKGRPNVGDRLAVVMDKNKRKARVAIDISMLMGVWMMPNPIDGSNEVGIRFLDGGIAEGVNQSTTVYQSWRLMNGKLLITSVDSDDESYVLTSTYRIQKLTPDSLVYSDENETLEYYRNK